MVESSLTAAAFFTLAAVLCLMVVFTGVSCRLPMLVAPRALDSGAGAVSVDITRSLFNAFDDSSEVIVQLLTLSCSLAVAALAPDSVEEADFGLIAFSRMIAGIICFVGDLT